ncbi:phosphatase PAP2 family protein [Mycolicibacterium sp. GCM10028919]|uniref:phosphatase PAP2 family protein n=1 Tax=Mycolicibacterium sp. GCM10028919 TaxID=3273401 RepID=UPI003620B0E3
MFPPRAKWAVASAALAAAVYVALWIGWTSPWNWIVDVDTSTLATGYRLAAEHPAWVGTWDAICTLFSPFVFRVVAVGVIVHAFIRKNWRPAVFLLLAVELSGPLTVLAKWVGDRPRPDTAMVAASSTSFPSGHAVGVMASVLAFAVVLAPYVRADLRRVLAVAGVLVVVAVGVGRVALNVHHASDVVAGWALGYLWVLVCLPVIRPLERTRSEAGTPAVPDSER